MIEELSNIVREVGSRILIWRESNIFDGKWEGSQFKARVDIMAHNELERLLTNFTSSIPVVSEENVNSHTDKRPERYWLIDPIDGTASFVNGYQGFVTQVALMEKNKPKYAAIFAPALNELYTAEKGKGAYCNNRRIILHEKSTLETLIDNYPEPMGIAKKVFNDFAVKNYIECGSISLKICRVAEGTADLFIKDVPVRDWDLAAPQLVLEESGGTLIDLRGEQIRYNGNYEHLGLIVTQNTTISNMIVQWHTNKGGQIL